MPVQSFAPEAFISITLTGCHASTVAVRIIPATLSCISALPLLPNRSDIMSKSQDSKKAVKKEPAKSPKEKKEAKKLKKEAKKRQ